MSIELVERDGALIVAASGERRAASVVCVFDTETTSREDDREPIEAALLQLPQGHDLLGVNPDVIPANLFPPHTIFAGKLKPSKPSTYGSMAVHHILPSQLEDCPPSSGFRLPPDVAYIVGHSVDFDWEAIGRPNVKRICTHAMAQSIWPQADSHSQSALLYMLLGPMPETRELLKNAHSALADAVNNIRLLEKILEAKPDIRTWSALYAFSEEARIPTVMPMGRNKGALIAELESGEIEWYLDRDFIGPYLRKAFENEIARRRVPVTVRDEDDDSDLDDDVPY